MDNEKKTFYRTIGLCLLIIVLIYISYLVGTKNADLEFMYQNF
jgi:surface polysaccharide O-acyltransferase-like enzyme